MSVKTRIIKIGNSQGIRIPKVLLEQSGIDAEVEIEVQGDSLTIRKAPRSRSCASAQSRAGWDEAFAAMSERGDDTLLDGHNATQWDMTEWEWSSKDLMYFLSI